MLLMLCCFIRCQCTLQIEQRKPAALTKFAFLISLTTPRFFSAKESDIVVKDETATSGQKSVSKHDDSETSVGVLLCYCASFQFYRSSLFGRSVKATFVFSLRHKLTSSKRFIR